MSKNYTNEELYKLSIETESEEDRNYYKNELMKQNIPLVKRLTKEYCKKETRLDPDEAYSAALKGLFYAYRAYNPNKKIKFATYAYHIIRREICHQITALNHKKNLMSWDAVRLDSKITEEEDTYYHDVISKPYENQYESLLSELSKDNLLGLIPEEINRKIILLHSVYEYTFEEIGKILNISRQGVYDRYKRILNKLKISSYKYI